MQLPHGPKPTRSPTAIGISTAGNRPSPRRRWPAFPIRPWSRCAWPWCMVVLQKRQPELDRPGVGPEALGTILAQMRPADLGLTGEGNRPREAVLDRFAVSLLTEGSGTQIFSTSFAQWAAREALRRA